MPTVLGDLKMSRKSRRRSGRDASAIARRSLPRVNYSLRSLMDGSQPRLSLGQDRRVFSPAPLATRTFGGIPTRLIAKHKASARRPATQRLSWEAWPPVRVAFDVPKSVALCVRRKIRSEVLHALDIAGSRGLGRGGVRRGPYSGVGC